MAARRGCTELILATDPNIEGEATATYLAAGRGRWAQGHAARLGLPVGGDLEYADEVTLGRAFEGRCSMSDEVQHDGDGRRQESGPWPTSWARRSALRHHDRGGLRCGAPVFATLTQVTLLALIAGAADGRADLRGGPGRGSRGAVRARRRPRHRRRPAAQGVANLFEGLDDYAQVVDPLINLEVERDSISGDLAEMA